MLTKEKRQEIISQYGKNPQDSGSAEVQVALLTERISYLTPHFGSHKHDHHSMTGFRKIIGKRRSLLKYIHDRDPKRYEELTEKLGIRKVKF